MDTESKRVGFLIERSYRIIKKAFIQRFEVLGIDITPNQYIILDLVARKDGISQKELTEHSFKDPPTVSRMVELLVRKKWLDRQSATEDRRRSTLSLTPTGMAIIEKCTEEIEKLRSDTWKGLSDEDYSIFQSIMDRLYQNLTDVKK
jgi:DNA-binding MarR family transcriptional regulator